MINAVFAAVMMIPLGHRLMEDTLPQPSRTVNARLIWLKSDQLEPAAAPQAIWAGVHGLSTECSTVSVCERKARI
ncbi:hypothetical protein D3C81_1710460 [compost metagenome]